MRYVSVLGLILKARVFGNWLRPSKGLLTAFLEENGEKRSENLLSRSPLEKPDTQDSPIEEPVYKCHILQLSIFSIMNGSLTRPIFAQIAALKF